MASPYVTFPDATQLLIDEVRANLAGDATVASRPPNPLPDRLVVIRRVGGARLNLVTDNPLFAIEAWAADEETAADLAEEVRGLVHSLRGSTVGGSAVYRVEEAAGPGFLPDPVSNRPRYTFTMSVAMRGLAPGGR